MLNSLDLPKKRKEKKVKKMLQPVFSTTTSLRTCLVSYRAWMRILSFMTFFLSMDLNGNYVVTHSIVYFHRSSLFTLLDLSFAKRKAKNV